MDSNILFDYSKLRGRITEKCGTIEACSKTFAKSRTTLFNTLNNRREFKQKEIMMLCNFLNIRQEQIPEFFFAIKVQKNEQKNKN